MTQEIWKYEGGGSPEGSGSLLDQSGGEAALRKGPWAKEEDEILLRYVKEKGIVKWTSIGKHTGLARSGKSCRLRWLNHLRPNLKKGSFSKDEQNLIVWMHSKYGNKWTRIASKVIHGFAAIIFVFFLFFSYRVLSCGKFIYCETC